MKLFTLCAAALLAFGASSADAAESSTTWTGPRGNTATTSSSTDVTVNEDGTRTRESEMTGPRGNTVTSTSDVTVNEDGTTTRNTTITGPNGKEITGTTGVSKEDGVRKRHSSATGPRGKTFKREAARGDGKAVIKRHHGGGRTTERSPSAGTEETSEKSSQ